MKEKDPKEPPVPDGWPRPVMPSPLRLVFEPRPRRWRLAFWRKRK